MSNKRLSTKQAYIEADDLLTEILLRLPPRSICHFISICKQWHSLITDAVFYKLWRKRNIKLTTGLFLDNTNKLISFSSNKSSNTIHSSSSQTSFKIEQSCNGLLLCTTGTTYHVYNPTTDMFVTLPNVPNTHGFNKELCIMTMSLAFDPNISPYFKVISRNGIHQRMTIYHIYSSQTLRWELKIDREFQCIKSYFKGEGIYWNGSINWIHALLCFDIENRISKAMPAPVDPIGDRVYFYGESCGRLNYTVIHRSKPCTIDVYELKRDYSQWILRYTVILNECLYYTTTVLSVVHGVEEDDSFLVLRLGQRIVRYNLVSKTSEELLVLPPGSLSVRAFQHVDYPFSF